MSKKEKSPENAASDLNGLVYRSKRRFFFLEKNNYWKTISNRKFTKFAKKVIKILQSVGSFEVKSKEEW